MAYTVKVPREDSPSQFRFYTWDGEIKVFDTESEATSWVESLTPTEENGIASKDDYVVVEYNIGDEP